MTRYFIKLAYNGRAFHGWQSQPNAVTIQATIENALSLILKTPIEIIGAGRTDAGVHAQLMFAQFDTEISFDRDLLIAKLNSFLTKSIVIFDFIKVDSEAHVRFDATSRTYEYHIHQFKNAFFNEQSWYYFKKLDIDLMNQAAEILLDHTDFECFSKTHTDVNTFNCTITEAFWQKNDTELIFTISANRFLRNMVRAIVGTLVEIGLEKYPVSHMEWVIKSKDRKNAGFSVPAHGLFLTDIKYPYL
uniref:tRNA pseudouridine(38-40) synthase TruA n=1 Tax=Flavobacterium sp. TaxID=239 RepID=UPI0040491C87